MKKLSLLITLLLLFTYEAGAVNVKTLSPQDFPSVPEKPLQNLISFLQTETGKSRSIKLGPKQFRTKTVGIPRYVALIDFRLPSDEKRLFVLDLQSKNSFSTFVTHGENSGGRFATQFSNRAGSNQSSLGFYLTGTTYYGSFGYSLKLFGLDSTNDNAHQRYVVMHGADYASEKVIEKTGELGKSQGCPAMDPKIATTVINLLKNGGLLYIYHPALE